MKTRWTRGLAPTSACVMLLGAGCDEPLKCQYQPPEMDMAAPSDMAAEPAPDLAAQLASFSCRCTDQLGRPLQGVVVTLGGKSAQSGADGTFTVSDVPVTARVIKLDGSAVTPPPDPEVVAEARRDADVARGVATKGPRRYGAIAQEITLQPGASSGREQAFVLPLSSPLEDLSASLTDDDLTTEELVLTPPGDGYEDALSSVRLRIQRGTKIGFPPGALRALSLTRVPPQLAPGTPGAGAGASLVVMIQPQGTTFDPPVELVLPTHSGAPEGQRQDLLSLDLDTGRYVQLGAGTVETGEGYPEVIPDAVARIPRAGYHLALCPAVKLEGVVRRGESPQAGARVEARTPDSLSENYEITYALPAAAAVTGADGRYSLSGLRACSLYVRASTETNEGVLTLSGLASLTNEGQPLTQDLDLDTESSYRRFNLRVRVKNPDDMDKPFAGVSAYAADCLGGECYGETDAQGEVVLRDVLGPPGGTIDVELCGNRGGSEVKQVDVPARTPAPPTCGVIQDADVQQIEVTTSCVAASAR